MVASVIGGDGGVINAVNFEGNESSSVGACVSRQLRRILSARNISFVLDAIDLIRVTRLIATADLCDR